MIKHEIIFYWNKKHFSRNVTAFSDRRFYQQLRYSPPLLIFAHSNLSAIFLQPFFLYTFLFYSYKITFKMCSRYSRILFCKFYLNLKFIFLGILLFNFMKNSVLLRRAICEYFFIGVVCCQHSAPFFFLCKVLYISFHCMCFVFQFSSCLYGFCVK